MTIIRVLDLETIGLEPVEGGGVCEIGFCDVVATQTDLVGDPINWIVMPGYGQLIHPGHPIPPVASAVHHLIDEDVRDAPPWPDGALGILTQLFSHGSEIVAFAAHNAKFERQWLCDELTGSRPWCCTYKAALRLWPDAPLHSNQGLRYWRCPAGLDRAAAAMAHRAWPDAYVTAHLLRDMLNDGATVKQMIEWSDQPALQVTCHIGKWRGTPWREVDDGFLAWVSDRDFDEDVLFTVRHEMDRRQAEYEREQAELRAPRHAVVGAGRRVSEG